MDPLERASLCCMLQTFLLLIKTAVSFPHILRIRSRCSTLELGVLVCQLRWLITSGESQPIGSEFYSIWKHIYPSEFLGTYYQLASV